MTKSWKTSAAGIGAILIAVGSALSSMFDNNPATVADWGAVVAAVIAGIGLLAARDNGVSSEDAGVK
jgi:uncharacterized membrane protein YhiD involved in acid resistance